MIMNIFIDTSAFLLLWMLTMGSMKKPGLLLHTDIFLKWLHFYAFVVILVPVNYICSLKNLTDKLLLFIRESS